MKLQANQKIQVIRKQIYASSGACSERETSKIVASVQDIDGQDAQIVRFKGAKDGRAFRLDGIALNSSYPSALKYEIIA